MPMEGFSEQGTPAEWDMAVGKVRGYRWWFVNIFLRSIHPWNASRYSYEPYRRALPERTYPFGLAPELGGVMGMHGGRWWSRSRENGWFEAECEARTFTGINCKRQHDVPATDCGCGYWAYWQPTANDFSTRASVQLGRDEDYAIAIPVFGVIEGSGRTIIGDRGFRTQRAKITDLTLAPGSFDFEDQSRESYHRRIHELIDPDPASLIGSLSAVMLRYQIVEVPLFRWLAQRTTVPEDILRAGVIRTLVGAVGSEFELHESLTSLVAACTPDENYGGIDGPV